MTLELSASGQHGFDAVGLLQRGRGGRLAGEVEKATGRPGVAGRGGAGHGLWGEQPPAGDGSPFVLCRPAGAPGLVARGESGLLLNL